MSASEKKPVIVIRRIKKIKKSGHHGGSWKIAYADFVTALMSFFLLMWLLSLLNKYQLQGVAEYFKHPLKKAFHYRANKNGLHEDKDKNKNKEQYKEKPNKIDEQPDKDKRFPGMSEKDWEHMEAIKKEFEKRLDARPDLQQFKNQLNFIVTADGLKIQIRDLEDKEMFTTGKADFREHAKNVLGWLSAELNQYPNQIVIIGHTDSALYDNQNYTNWELSPDRANAARRALIQYGMVPDKIRRIIGVGDHDLLNVKNGLDPSNRRIEIIILTDEAMKKLVDYPK